MICVPVSPFSDVLDYKWDYWFVLCDILWGCTMTDQRNHFTKVSGGTDEFMGFLGGVWESQRKGSYITKKIHSQHGWPKDWAPGAPCAACRQLNWRVFSPSRFFTTSLNSGRSHMSDVKFLELPESYKFPVSFPCLLAPVPSLYKRRFQFRGNSYIMLLG